jgi:hypothetical protein
MAVSTAAVTAFFSVSETDVCGTDAREIEVA